MRSLKNLGGLVVPGWYRFKEPDEKETFQRLPDLVDFVLEYRLANGIEVESRAALQAEIEDWICHQIGSVEYYCLQDGKAMPPKDHTGAPTRGNTGYQGQQKWKELHEWALGEGTAIPGPQWMEIFTGSLPCGDCRREWRKLVRDNPPPYDAEGLELFRWSVDRHNDVRQRLGQEPLSLEAAVSLYAVQEDTQPQQP